MPFQEASRPCAECQKILQKEEEAAAFDSIPQLAHLGQPFQSTKAERLTEEETEYSVTLIKHVFESNILLQFTCTNTVAEQVLEKVSVSLELEDAVRAQLPQIKDELIDKSSYTLNFTMTK